MDLQIPLQRQSNEAAQVLPAIPFHTQSAVHMIYTVNSIEIHIDYKTTMELKHENCQNYQVGCHNRISYHPLDPRLSL